MKKETALKDFISGIYAGIFIGIGGIIYLTMVTMGQPILGAFLFGFGLFTICHFQFKLYTGQVGYLPPNLPIILLGNLIGAAAVGFVIPYTRLAFLVPFAVEICKAKLTHSAFDIIVMSFFCGILMYVAVQGHKYTGYKPLIIFLSIAIFILCGFEHCIAATVYFAIAHQISKQVFLAILYMVLGNSLGSLFIGLPERKYLD